MAAKKPSKFVNHSWYELQELCVRCNCSHDYQHLIGGRATHAQEYPDKLRGAICSDDRLVWIVQTWRLRRGIPIQDSCWRFLLCGSEALVSCFAFRSAHVLRAQPVAVDGSARE